MNDRDQKRVDFLRSIGGWNLEVNVSKITNYKGVFTLFFQ